MTEILAEEGEVLAVTIHPLPDEPYEFRVKTAPDDRRGTVFYVNPYTGETLKPEKTAADAFFFFMFKLHRWLLLDLSIGRPIGGIATIIFIVLSVSGLVLWFPKKLKWKNFKNGFKIKFSARWKRINHDLHNTLGFYTALILIVMGLTGLSWSFDWYREGASAVISAKIFDRSGGSEFTATTDPDDFLPVAEILKIVENELQYPGEVNLRLPSEPSDIHVVRKKNTDNFMPVATDRIFIDRDGRVLRKELFGEKPWNVQLAALIKPIHTGAVFGGFSKLIYFIGCLFATSLPVTGTIIWINKLKKKRKKRKTILKGKTGLVISS